MKKFEIIEISSIRSSNDGTGIGTTFNLWYNSSLKFLFSISTIKFWLLEEITRKSTDKLVLPPILVNC